LRRNAKRFFIIHLFTYKIFVQNTEPTYFETRCAAIGLTAEKNKFSVKRNPAIKNSAVDDFFVLVEDKKTGDIEIPLYDINGNPRTFYQDNPGKLQNGKEKYLCVRRYKPGNERKVTEKGKERILKYDIPKGVKAFPWVSPNIIEANLDGKTIDTIVITEGQIKAIAGWLNGLYIFGITGHSNLKDKDTQALHSDIAETIVKCKVKNVVILYDGDCNILRSKDVEEKVDLRTRPHSFFLSAQRTRELLKDLCKDAEFDIYFSHVNTQELEGGPKGLDDLLEAYPDSQKDIVKEITTFSKQVNKFFFKTNITHGLTKVLQQLHLFTAEQFYTANNQFLKDKEFVYSGSNWKWLDEEKRLTLIIPEAIKNYFRVGDNYYEKVKVPNADGLLEYRYDRRQIGTITGDHGKNFLGYIPKYKAFCTKPDHQNWQDVIHNCYNRYRPFEHEPSADDHSCPETLGFCKHIFGDQLEIGLDYIQLLYQRPTQKLPILCLVSEENNTGKSTFVFLMKAIFTGNMTVIGNAELEDNFNANWADKLIISVEESFIDKKKIVEKIKALSTGKKITMNQKGIDHVEIDFFGKFILCSNREENFIIANEHDERFWVRRVPKFKSERTNLLELMVEEIPSFLLYLNKRKLANECKGRMWFDKNILATDALKKLIVGNTSTTEKEIRYFMRTMMLEHGFKELQFTSGYIKEKILRGKWDSAYVEKILKKSIKVQTSTTTKHFKFPVVTINHLHEEELVLAKGHGKPYTFTAEMILNAEEIESIVLCDEAISIGQEKSQLTIDEPF
jgi:hypothetical protein